MTGGAIGRAAVIASVALAVAACSVGSAPTAASPSGAGSSTAVVSPLPSPVPSAPGGPVVASVVASPVAMASPQPLTREQAITIGRRLAIGSVATWAAHAQAGPFRQFDQPPGGKFPPPTPSPDHWVWRVAFVSPGGSVSVVIIDYYSGQLIETEVGTP